MSTEYGKRLRQARKGAGLTQNALSKRTGIPQSTISTAEREGEGSGSLDTSVYAKALGVDAHWLATGAESSHEAKEAWPFTMFTLNEFKHLPEVER